MNVLLAAAETQQQANPIIGLLPFVLVGVALYFIMIRPQKRRMQEQRNLIASVEVGDEILTIGGIFGTIRLVDDEEDELTIEVAPGTVLRIVKSAVARKVYEDEAEDDDGNEDASDDEEGPWFDEDSDESEAGEEK